MKKVCEPETATPQEENSLKIFGLDVNFICLGMLGLYAALIGCGGENDGE